MPKVILTAAGVRKELSEFDRLRGQAGARMAHVPPRTDSPRELCFNTGKAALYRYGNSSTHRDRRVPLLIVYALVNRPYILDLLPQHSVLADLASHGADVHLIEWGDPTDEDGTRTLRDYFERDLHACVEHLCAASGVPKINLLGVCQGGVFALCYAARRPERIQKLITVVTPGDFHSEDDILSRMLRHFDARAWSNEFGCVPGEYLSALFLSLKPWQLTQQKYLDFIARVEDNTSMALFMAMERWVFDSPNLAGTALGEFIQSCYQRNDLVQGRIVSGGETLALPTLTLPFLNVYGARDHLVPPASSRGLHLRALRANYSELEIDAGHIGIFINARARQRLVEGVSAWLSAPVGRVRKNAKRG